eukprot:COSAG01_NODE_51641_length_353_cov_0.779528_1_plen_76_part_10
MQKLRMLVEARAVYVRRDDEAEAARKEAASSPSFKPVEVTAPSGPTMLEQAQQNLERVVSGAQKRQAQAEEQERRA